MQEENSAGFRLSPQQNHLWQLQREGNAQPFRVQGSVRMAGKLDLETLHSAFAQVIEQNEILRTTFHAPPGAESPLQIVGEQAAGHHGWEAVDLTHLPPQEQETRVETLAGNLGQLVFDFEKGPLLHAILVTFSPSNHLLLVNVPAMCSDARSLHLLSMQMGQAYQAALRGEAYQDDEALQYSDLAERQIEWLKTDDAKAEIEQWDQQMVAAPLAVNLLDEEPSSATSFAPASVRRPVPPEFIARIEGFLTAHQVSAFAFFLACWQVLLFRLSGQSDTTLGLGCDGRTYDELENPIGLFAKYLPLPFHMEDHLKPVDMVLSVQEAVDERFERQEFFSWDLAGRGHSDEFSPFFPICFDFEGQPGSFQGDDFTLICETQFACVERFHLKLACQTRDVALVESRDNLPPSGRWTTDFYYDANLYRMEDMERLADQYLRVIENMIAAPGNPIGDFNVLTADQQHQILAEFNDTRQDYPAGVCIHHLIEEQAARTPENDAVFFKNQHLTYAELNARANQLAGGLQKLGVGPETLVGIMTEPSIETLVGILGILKAGGAYVPMDPEYPQERLTFIVEDTQMPVLLTQERLLNMTAEQKVRVFCLDSDWEQVSGESPLNPSGTVGAENLAYSIYTSGSTGQPKGVLVSHQNLVHSTHARVLYYTNPVGRYLLLSSFSFDSSVAGIFWSLIQGGALVLTPSGTERDPRAVTDMMAHYQVTHSLCLASHYAVILAEAEKTKMATLKTAIVSGEVFSNALLNRHDHLSSGAELFNEYGPTEASVWCIVFDCHDPFLGNKVPIGKPIANTQVYLLNAYLRPVPIGVPGDMYIGGVGVTRGYLNRPGLTAESFIPDPFGDRPGARLYQTGDVARYLPDGRIEFLGRRDDQVKIRGYRIELGEIEALLGKYPAVTEVAVIVREDTPGDKRLVAYLSPQPGQELTTGLLRDYLKEKLPDYMVPGVFVIMDSLPRTPIGKLDPDSLPVPTRARPTLNVAYEPPRTAVEVVLAGMWADILDIGEVGIQDNFFELGGHSILILQLVSRIRDTLQVDLPLRTLFDAPTVADVSELLLHNAEERARVETIARLIVKVEKLSEDDVNVLLKSEGLL